MSVVVIGAGMSGLACAEALRLAGRDIVVLDKGRGPGGRMATRRLETATGEVRFDLGTQSFTARDPQFVSRVHHWSEAGQVAPWPPAGADAWVGVPGMNAPLRAMADRLDVRWGTKVVGLSRRTGGWDIGTEDGTVFAAEAVVVALPAEQSADLLAPVAPVRAAQARACPSLPCWTVLLAFAEPLASDETCLSGEAAEELGQAVRNCAKPARDGAETWVVHGGADWSTRHLDHPATWIEETLLTALARRLGCPLPQTIARGSHRWRYASSTSGGSGPSWDPGIGLGVCGDWLTRPGVEGAWLSGTGLAAKMGTPAEVESIAAT
jgi:predicted NAD/FAD-dependent oxidoreductase